MLDENKILDSNDEQRNSISGRSTPVSMLDRHDVGNNVDDEREDDDDDVQMTLPVAVSSAPSAHGTLSATNSIIGSTTMTTTSATASNGINTLTTTTKSTNDNNDIDTDCDDTAAKDKEVINVLYYLYLHTSPLSSKSLIGNIIAFIFAFEF